MLSTFLSTITEDSTADEVISHMYGYSSTERSHALADWGQLLSDSHDSRKSWRPRCRKWWKVVPLVWGHCDLIPHERFEELFDDFCVFDDDTRRRNLPKSLPQRFEVYRGQDRYNAVGLSWTLSREVAQGFAIGHRGILNPNPVILKRTIAHSDVAFYLAERGEAEVVLTNTYCGEETNEILVTEKRRR